MVENNKNIALNQLSTDILEVVDYSLYPVKQDIDKVKKEVEELSNKKVPEHKGMESIKWLELKALRDNAQLVAGRQYRITDYVATTAQEDTMSANRPFDIIVTADDEWTLNESARAILHNRDEYFANCDLAAWELKYCIDNDAERFAWAADGKVKSFCVRSSYDNTYIEAGGKFTPIGLLSDVIADIHYGERITEEFPEGKYIWASENDHYYSYAITESEYFSQGSRVFYCEANGDSEHFGYTDDVVKNVCGKGVVYYMKDEWNNECPYDFKGIAFAKPGSYSYYYTFNFQLRKAAKPSAPIVVGQDASVITASGKYINPELGIICNNNTIKEFFNLETNTRYLNNVVFTNRTSGTICTGNHIGLQCQNISLGTGCQYISLYNTTGAAFNSNSKHVIIESIEAVEGINLSELFPQIVQTTTPYKVYRIGADSNGELVCINNYDAVSVDTSGIENAIGDIESNVSENEEVIAAAFERTRKTIGADENIKVTFSGTNNLDGCESLLEAILLLDSKLSQS